MDMMEMRFRMMAMLGGADMGAEVIKGTFTAPSSGSSYTINFSKTFSKYIYFVEMTDTDKATLLATGYNASKCVAWLGKYPQPYISENISFDYNAYFSFRVNPSTSATLIRSATVSDLNGSSLTIAVDNVSGSSGNSAYMGYSYNYIIISLDNV